MSRVYALALVLLVSIAAAHITVRAQFDYIGQHYGAHYIATEDYGRHRGKVDGSAIAPYRYRIFTDTLIAATYSQPKDYPAVLYRARLMQNTLIFALLAAFLWTLGSTLPACLLGIALLAYGMQGAFFQSDVSAYTYTNLIFFLLAAVAIGLRRDWWIIPLSAVAALNREEAVFLPVMLLAARWMEAREGSLWRQKWARQAALAFVACLFSFVAVRLLVGAGNGVYAGSRYGDVQPGFYLFTLNWQNAEAWAGMRQMLGLLPAFLLLWRAWPRILKTYAVAVAAPIFLAQFVCGSADETRLFLVPLALVLVPAVVCSVNPGHINPPCVNPPYPTLD